MDPSQIFFNFDLNLFHGNSRLQTQLMTMLDAYFNQEKPSDWSIEGAKIQFSNICHNIYITNDDDQIMMLNSINGNKLDIYIENDDKYKIRFDGYNYEYYEGFLENYKDWIKDKLTAEPIELNYIGMSNDIATIPFWRERLRRLDEVS